MALLIIGSIQSGVALRLPRTPNLSPAPRAETLFGLRSWGLLTSLAAPQALCCRALRALSEARTEPQFFNELLSALSKMMGRLD